MTLCEENCKLIEYNKDSKKSKCSCDIKLSIPLFEDIKFNKDEFYKSFTDLKNMLNLNVMKCYKKVFNKTLINNYGFFIMIFIFILYFLCLFIFLFHSHKKLFKDINGIMNELNYNKGVGLKKIYRKKIIRKNLISSINNDKKTKIDKIIFLNNENQEKDKSNKQIIETGYNNRIINFKNISNKSKDILDYKDFELNKLEYSEVIKLDKRNYIQFYISSLKNYHPLIFSFSPYKDYNSRIIKIFMFFFSICLNLIINSLFFSDDTMHKIYKDKGNYDFIYQIPQILYSSIISGIINALTTNLGLSQENIIKFKHLKEKEKLEEKHKKLLKTLKIKFILYFSFTFILLNFFLFYITCFCGIYINTQIHLIKDTLSSFTSSLIFPFGLYLLPGIFRLYAFKSEKEYAYKFSSLLGLILF